MIDRVDASVTIEYGDVPEPFFGIYCTALPGRCFNAAGNKLFFSTPQETEVRSYVYNMGMYILNSLDVASATAKKEVLVPFSGSDKVLLICARVMTTGSPPIPYNLKA